MAVNALTVGLFIYGFPVSFFTLTVNCLTVFIYGLPVLFDGLCTSLDRVRLRFARII